MNIPTRSDLATVLGVAFCTSLICTIVSIGTITLLKKGRTNKEASTVAATTTTESQWESVPTTSVFWNVYRLRVHNGWLYSSRGGGEALCFVPDSTTTTANKE